MKIKVAILGTIGKSAQIEGDAPSRTEVTAQIAAAVANVSSASRPSVTTVIWRFIQEVPANIKALAAFTGVGILVRKSDSNYEARSVATAASTRLTVTNGSGVAGNPTLDLGANTIASLALADTAVQPAALNAVKAATFLTTANETALLTNSRQLLAGTNVTFDDTVAGKRTVNASGGSGSALVPATIGGLVYWLETDLLASPSAEPVPMLGSRDPVRSPVYGTTTDAAAAAGATVDSSTLNSLPVLNLPGTTAGDYGLSAALKLKQSTVFVVFKSTTLGAGGTSYTFMSGPATALQFRLNSDTLNTSGSLQLAQDNTAIIGSSTANGVAINTWYQANCTYNDSSGAYAFRLAKTAAGSGTNAKTIAAISSALFYDLGNGVTQHFNGLIAGLIVYNRVLTSPEIAAVEAYLTAKWGV